MNKKQSILLTLLMMVLATLFSCTGGSTSSSLLTGDTLALKYSSNLSIVKHEGYTEVKLRNPWKKGKILHTYLLVPHEKEIPSPLPEGTVIRTPVRRAVVFTTVHCSLFMTLGKGDCIAGVADLKYIKIPWIQEQCKKGLIADCGEGLSPVVEKVIDINPDVLLLSPFENSGGYGKLEEINIPIVECAEYMETSPLGRAEWMKFYGLLLGEERQTQTLFAEVDSSYNALKDLAKTSKISRSVIVDKVTGSVWYVPGGKSTIGQMLVDAGGDYPFAKDTHSGSLPLPFESVLEKGGHCDVWLYRYSSDRSMTLKDLHAEQPGYSQLKAYQSGEVYGCNVEKTLFYEQSPFRPDYLLNDFIQILHPDMEGLSPLRYYFKMEINK